MWQRGGELADGLGNPIKQVGRDLRADRVGRDLDGALGRRQHGLGEEADEVLEALHRAVDYAAIAAGRAMASRTQRKEAGSSGSTMSWKRGCRSAASAGERRAPYAGVGRALLQRVRVGGPLEALPRRELAWPQHEPDVEAVHVGEHGRVQVRHVVRGGAIYADEVAQALDAVAEPELALLDVVDRAGASGGPRAGSTSAPAPIIATAPLAGSGPG